MMELGCYIEPLSGQQQAIDKVSVILFSGQGSMFIEKHLLD